MPQFARRESFYSIIFSCLSVSTSPSSPQQHPNFTTPSKPKDQNVVKEEKRKKNSNRGNPTRGHPFRAKKAKSQFFRTISKVSPFSAATATTLTFVTANPNHNTFQPFPRLPVEIWLKIWDLAAAGGVIIGSRKELRIYLRRIPVLLHTYHENREEFLHKDGIKKNHPTYKLCGGIAKLREENKI